MWYPAPYQEYQAIEQQTCTLEKDNGIPDEITYTMDHTQEQIKVTRIKFSKFKFRSL